MEKIIFIGGVLPDNKIDEIMSNSNSNIDFAAHNFQNKILKGIKENGYDYEVISVPFISSYPKYYKKIIVNFKDVNNCKFLKFFNLSYIKIISRYLVLRKELIKLSKNKNDKKVIFMVYSLHFPFLKNLVLIKKIFKNCKVNLIVPDLQEYMSDNKSFIYRLLKKIEVNVSKKYYKYVDNYTILTEYMNEKINTFNKPYTVIEGIADELNYDTNVNKTLFETKYLLYTGTLAERYGVKNLVEAFDLLKDNEYKLYICGKGDSEEFIKSFCKKNKNIIFMGLVSPEKSKELQKNAFMLVNPRKNIGEYTKYSFPSKIMEYVSTGKPVLCYKLDGFPTEYDDVLIYPKNDSIIELANSIEKVFQLDKEELQKIHKKSMELISRKTPKKAVLKILNLLNKEEE